MEAADEDFRTCLEEAIANMRASILSAHDLLTQRHGHSPNASASSADMKEPAETILVTRRSDDRRLSQASDDVQSESENSEQAHAATDAPTSAMGLKRRSSALRSSFSGLRAGSEDAGSRAKSVVSFAVLSEKDDAEGSSDRAQQKEDPIINQVNQSGNESEHSDAQSITSGSSSSSEEDDEEVHTYWLSPSLMDRTENVRGMHPRLDRSQSAAFTMAMSELSDTLAINDGSWVRSCTMHPDSMKRLIWNACSCLFFAYDAVTIPLRLFVHQSHWPLTSMTVLVFVFLVCDIILSLLTGHRVNHNTVDMRPRTIFMQYLKTWLMFDCTMVAADLGCIAFSFVSGTLAAVFKVASLVRLLRIIKLMRTHPLPACLVSKNHDETHGRIVGLGLVRVVIWMVWFNHIVACGWYALGLGWDGDLHSWLDVQTEPSAGSQMYEYLSSYHWSLSLFTGSSPGVVPTNTAERLYAVCCQIAALVINIILVSTITTIMTQLQIVTADRARAFADLSRYLYEHSISPMLSLRIQDSARVAVEESSRNKSEESIDLIRLISEPLRIELHYEVYAQVLKTHPFFSFYDLLVPDAMKRLCHTGVLSLRIARGDVLYNWGDSPEMAVMYFLTNGMMTYRQSAKSWPVKTGEFFSEPALWTAWSYCGSMTACSDCQLILLSADAFQKVVCQFVRKDANPIAYGQALLNAINQVSQDCRSDRSGAMCDEAELVERVFGNDEKYAAMRISARRESLMGLSAFSRRTLNRSSVSSRVGRRPSTESHKSVTSVLSHTQSPNRSNDADGRIMGAVPSVKSRRSSISLAAWSCARC
eukprot:TRINITY_DN73558_c0_g1_i1.p1 TRINITY_DN73558_c0_g1~~TRINITY_DN73558_c0_g1_i1.p1  ORF type:complete len:816 (-),score=97.81 TRINITY_DN73558_c0_g1_i1:206-2653(-)